MERGFSHEDVRARVVGVMRGFMEEFGELPRDLDVSLLMSHELGVDGYRVDAVLGGIVVLEFKSRDGELEKAAEEARDKYLSRLPGARYLAVIGPNTGIVYRVDRGDNVVELTKLYAGQFNEAVKVVGLIALSEIDRLKVEPTPSRIMELFSKNSHELIDDMEKAYMAVKDTDLVKPSFEAYSKIMRLLYAGLEGRDKDTVDLFIKHTLLQMMAAASLTAALGLRGHPVDACSGALIASGKGTLISLPYLNWWKVVYDSPEVDRDVKEKIEKVAWEVSKKAHVVNWRSGRESDVFRKLYEILIDSKTRRELGEYYTPLWVVDLILSEFELRDKIVMDPFCGSGTFLVRAFHKKIREGEDPDKAYRELVGFDINPLAVVIARAELILAYNRVRGAMPNTPPRVYHVDTFAAWFTERGFPEAGKRRDRGGGDAYTRLMDALSKRIFEVVFSNSGKLSEMGRENAGQLLTAISNVEYYLSSALRYAHSVYREKHNVEEAEKALEKYLNQVLSDIRGDGLVVDLVKAIVKRKGDRASPVIRELAELIGTRGDSIWATALVSFIVPVIMNYIRPDIIVTNPPWIQVTKFKASYAGDMFRKAKSILREFNMKRKKEEMRIAEEKVDAVVNGSDIACMALYKAISKANEGVGFLMSRTQSFQAGAPQRAGILLTYAILKTKCSCGDKVKLIEIDKDVFSHGAPPTIVVVKKSGSGPPTTVTAGKDCEPLVELYRARVGGPGAR